VIRCARCGALNPVPPDKLAAGLEAVCARCETPLPRAHGPVTVTDATFARDIEQSPLPVLLDVWAPWCQPCRLVAPMVDQLAADLKGRARVGKLNVDDNPATAARFGVHSIPTLLVLKGGREVDRIVGVQPKDEIARRVESAMA
jgi:thioredoxin 2